VSLLFDQNLSRRLPALLGMEFPGSEQALLVGTHVVRPQKGIAMAKPKKSRRTLANDQAITQLGKGASLIMATCQALTQLDLSISAVGFIGGDGQEGQVAFSDVLEFLNKNEVPPEKWVETIEGFAYLYCTVNGIAIAPIPDEQVEALLDRNGVDLRQAFLLEDNPMFLNCDGLFVVGTPNPRWSDAVVAYFRMHGIPEFPKMDSDECRKWVSEAIVRLSAG